MAGSFDRYGEWVARGADVMRELREDGGCALRSYEEWAAGLQTAVCEAAEKGTAGDELVRVLMRVYGTAVVVVEDRLLPAITGSRYLLLHAFALDVAEDLRSFWYGTDGGLVPEVLMGAPRPDYHCRVAGMWRDWLLGCCDWLSDRAEAHRFMEELLASGGSEVAPQNADQLLVNCYGAAVVVAASAAGWATCPGPATAGT